MIGEPVLRMCGGSDSACIETQTAISRPIKFVKVLKAALDFQPIERPTDPSSDQSIDCNFPTSYDLGAHHPRPLTKRQSTFVDNRSTSLLSSIGASLTLL